MCAHVSGSRARDAQSTGASAPESSRAAEAETGLSEGARRGRRKRLRPVLGGRLGGTGVPADQRRVPAVRGEQFLVGAALGDAAGVQDDDLVGVADGGEPVGDGDAWCGPAESASMACCTACSVRVSRALVASSRMRTGGSRRMVRAMARRCFSPPEKR